MPERTRSAETETTEAREGEIVTRPEANGQGLQVRNEGGGLQRLADLAAQVPTADDDPTDAMVAYILDSDGAADWDALWKSASLREYVGHRIRVMAIRGAESSFEESRVGHFLILDVIDGETGERKVATTGSELTMAQLIVAHLKGWLPMDFMVEAPNKPTKRGRTPYHLRSLGRVIASEES